MAAVQIDQAQFEKMIREEKPVLVDYWAPWCGYCRRIGPAYDRLADAYQDRLAAVKINIDEDPNLAEAERIEVIPTLVLYKNGEAVGSIVAPESQVMIAEFIEQALEK